MFILTIDSDDPLQIRQALFELSQRPLQKDRVGRVHCGERFEYQVMREQPFTFMADFLHYNPDGNTLKKPVYSEAQMKIMDPHGIAGKTPEQLLSALENGEFNEKPEPTERDYEHSVCGYPI